VIEIGSVVNGKYQLTRLVGDGGMGSVYEAMHTVLGTRVAIKVLHPELAKRSGLVERFLQEARVAAQIRSPHVVQVTDVDRTPDGYAYIVMELLEGEPLSAVLDRERRLPVATASEYTLQILEALEAAHALHVIHRDLKPENVFVTFAAGRPVLKLIDFGIAKARRTDPQQRNLTVAGVVMGTAEYMAPEQARSADKVDPRSDLYAVGVMLYEMLSGVRPVQGDDARVIALKVERGEVAPLVQSAPDVPRELAGLVHRAMAARPELRFATATEMRLALEKASNARRPGTAPVPGPAAGPPQGGPGPEAALGTGTLKNVQAHDLPLRSATGPGGHGTAAASSPGPRTDAEGPHTERAPPPPAALTGQMPVAYAGPAVPPAPHHEGGRRAGGGGAGRIAALVALPILLGAGVVLVLMATGTWSFGSQPGDPTSNPSQTAQDAGPPPVTITTTTTPVVMTTTAPGTVPTLAPTGPARPGPGPGPHPSSSGHPQHPPAQADDGGAPQQQPFLFPTTIPGIPSGVIPFPTELPTNFPWPGQPQPPPAPTHSSGSI
jgi:eukaryotic-like serine/threonine-protein kinase